MSAPFSFHVAATNYRRRPSVRLGVASKREPFRVDWFDVFMGLSCLLCLALALAPIFMMQAILS